MTRAPALARAIAPFSPPSLPEALSPAPFRAIAGSVVPLAHAIAGLPRVIAGSPSPLPPWVPARAEFAFQELFLKHRRAFLVVPGHSTIA